MATNQLTDQYGDQLANQSVYMATNQLTSQYGDQPVDIATNQLTNQAVNTINNQTLSKINFYFLLCNYYAIYFLIYNSLSEAKRFTLKLCRPLY